MKFALLLLLPLLALSASIEDPEGSEELAETGADNGLPKQWAVLVAGSDGWYNYRHQADICHAYHILIKRGIPPSNIIVMMKDDIAHNPLNPKPGVLINKPNGTDVYHGVKIDYSGSAVTSKNFLNVLLGKKDALRGVGSGRVLQSGPKDNVFINFSDHGGTGILCFPEDDLSAKDLIKTLKEMTKKKRYGKLVLYIEACESGSMFDNLLPQNTKILASTASAYDESSWGYYCDYGNYPCLGDLYSINWMEHLDKKIPNKENLFDQYQLIRTLTFKSHANLYGDFKIGLGTSNSFVGPHNFEATGDNSDEEEENAKRHATAVPSREVTLHYLKRMAKEHSDPNVKSEYEKMISEIEKKRVLVDNIVDRIVTRTVSGDQQLKSSIEKGQKKLNMDMLTCYEDMYRLFSKKCINMFKNPYVLKHLYKFANICHMDAVYQEKATSAINAICHSGFPKITDTH